MIYDLYQGGPIDYADAAAHVWRHDARWWAGLNVFCPICMNKGETDYRAIIDRNTDALKRARFAVFDLRMIHHSIGTPVEIEQRIAFRSQIDGLDTFLVHPGAPGLFVRWWETRGAVRINSFAEASARVTGILSQVR